MMKELALVVNWLFLAPIGLFFVLGAVAFAPNFQIFLLGLPLVASLFAFRSTPRTFRAAVGVFINTIAAAMLSYYLIGMFSAGLVPYGQRGFLLALGGGVIVAYLVNVVALFPYLRRAP